MTHIQTVRHFYKGEGTCTSTYGGSRFLDYLDFQFISTEFGLAKDQKRCFSLFFLSFCAEMIFWGQKKRRMPDVIDLLVGEKA
jgi:hypothetical protein